MKYAILFFFVLLSFVARLSAQQALLPGKMNYTMMTKPNNIIYNDTIYKGSAQFKQLFYRSGNGEIIGSYQKHQSNKITGQIFNFAGAITLLIGVNQFSSNNSGTAWTLISAGFLSSVAGGYFNLLGQRHLLTAVDLFNQQYNKRQTVSVGVGNQSLGLVVKW